MNLNALPKQLVSFNFKKFNVHIMGLRLTCHVNLKLSTRHTARVPEEIHGIKISHTMVANYATAVSTVIKPLTDAFDYKPAI